MSKKATAEEIFEFAYPAKDSKAQVKFFMDVCYGTSVMNVAKNAILDYLRVFNCEYEDNLTNDVFYLMLNKLNKMIGTIEESKDEAIAKRESR